MNHERKPFDDKRVRRALTLALDRYEASKTLSRIAVVKEVGGIQVPGTPWATPPAELEKLAGYGRDIAASRAEARRLLREAGVPDGFSFTFKNRGIPQPYEPIAIWLIDQWRQIGLNVKMETIEASAHVSLLRRGDFDVASDAHCSFVVEPDIDIQKFQSTGISDNNYGRYKDPVLDDLFLKQARAVDPEERKRLLRAFEKRLLDEEVHYIYTLQWHRIVAAQREGPGLDDHARPLPEPAARRGVARGVAQGALARRSMTLASRRRPTSSPSVMIDSGWNWTAASGSDRVLDRHDHAVLGLGGHLQDRRAASRGSRRASGSGRR